MPTRSPSVYFSGRAGGTRYMGGATGPQPGVSESGAPIAFGTVRYGGSTSSNGAAYEERPRKKIGAIDPYDRLTGKYIPGYGKVATPPTGLFSVGPRGKIEDPWGPLGRGPEPAMKPVEVAPGVAAPSPIKPVDGFDPRSGFSGAPVFRTTQQRLQRELDVFGAPGATGREIAYNESFQRPGAVTGRAELPKEPSEIPGYYWQGGELKPIDPEAEARRMQYASQSASGPLDPYAGASEPLF